MSRCAWVDKDGVRCPAAGTHSASIRGDGARFCHAHAECRDARKGADVIDEYVLRGRSQALSDAERRTVAKRMTDCDQLPRQIDIPQIVAKRRERDKRRANELYSAALSGCIAAGMEPEAAQAEAIAHVYRVGLAVRLGLPAVPLVGADRRAGVCD